jgi:nucleotide-binding universal stress UspA family protein
MTLPTNTEWKKAFQEQLVTESKQATAYIEHSGRSTNVEVESVILEGSPAEEIIDFAKKTTSGLSLWYTRNDRNH